MKFPHIETDDLVLFGSFGLLAIGSALVVGATSGNAALSVGIALMVFGLLAGLVTFLAASGEPK